MRTLPDARGGAPAVRHRVLAMLWVCMLAAAGCFPGYVRVTLTGDATTNQGRPLQVLVRAVDQAQYRGESYAAVSALVIRPDASVLKSVLIEPRPGYSRSFWIKSSSDRALGFYFLYGSTTASWKLWLQPPLPWRIKIPTGRGGVDSNGVRECRIFR